MVLTNFIKEAFELLDEALNEKVVDGFRIITNIAEDIVESCDDFENKIINKDTKCSKSVVPTAMEFIKRGEKASICIGNFGKDKEATVCGHAWVVAGDDNKVFQTSVPPYKDPNELTCNIKIDLIPGNVEKSIELIKNKLK